MNRLENVIHNEKLVETDLGFRYEIGTMISYEVRYVLFHDKMTYIFKMNEIKEGKNSFFHLSVEEKVIYNLFLENTDRSSQSGILQPRV